jgi:hypothetical protein
MLYSSWSIRGEQGEEISDRKGFAMNRGEKVTQWSSNFRFRQTKRKHRRARFSGFVGDLADGNLVVGGIIEDISLGGFKISDIANSVVAKKHAYTAILTGGGKHYRLLVKPCWRHQGAGKDNADIGFKILDAPWEWVEFAMREIPELDYEDTFGFFSKMNEGAQR